MKAIVVIGMWLCSSVMFSQQLDYSDLKLDLQGKVVPLMKEPLAPMTSGTYFQTIQPLAEQQPSVFAEQVTYSNDFKALTFDTSLTFPEKRIDFNKFLTPCGPVAAVTSQDVMLGALKYYLLNKYLLSWLVKTEYN